ncbi:MAG: hypothetical protein JM58_14545 [Peptococcaceae bacterium BICA1-8]|nr:MAG: hypothetical protein JM58_14545 [Peptococcaceae bacterium BICA1-8]
MDQKELLNTLSYLSSEISRIETMAGTLSSIEKEHYNKLAGFDHNELRDVAVEEHSASRQLGTIKQMCVSMNQKITNLEESLKNS